MTYDELVERIACAMYGMMPHYYDWPIVREDHKEVWRNQARGAIAELAAIANIQRVFPEVEKVP